MLTQQVLPLFAIDLGQTKHELWGEVEGESGTGGSGATGQGAQEDVIHDVIAVGNKNIPLVRIMSDMILTLSAYKGMRDYAVWCAPIRTYSYPAGDGCTGGNARVNVSVYVHKRVIW